MVVKSCRLPDFICACMDVTSYLCLHEQTQIVDSAACGVGSQEFHS